MTVRIESPRDGDGFAEFVRFADRAHAGALAYWPALDAIEMPVLLGQSALAAGKSMRPFVAREHGEIVARVLAVVDPAYADRWGERLGHLAVFDALAGTRDAVRAMLDAACEWLRSEGAIAARAGSYIPIDGPFVIDAYDELPEFLARVNPDYYHALLKDAGFETEKGMVDYRIEVTSELVARYESALEAARRGGFEITPLSEMSPERRTADFVPAFNEAFYNHWGFVAISEAAFSEFFALFEVLGGLDTSVVAYRDGEVAGTLIVVPEQSAMAQVQPGYTLKDSERVNFLGIGVREFARGRGVNLAMASYAYLKLIRRGAKFVGYGFVLDDNWPSRRTGEKLGGQICSNYVSYRRNFSR
ncbi:MAG TPA: hypothetical protein VEC38_08800 [Candidatus Binataceae bacterium]|nr:hypothetical protein [Candidatus Binataceae bacterium]